MSKSEKLPENIKPEMIGKKRYVRISEGARRYSVRNMNTLLEVSIWQRFILQ